MYTKRWQKPWLHTKELSWYISQQHISNLGWAWKIYPSEVKYLLLHVLTKADCSGHIIKFHTKKKLRSRFLILNVVLQYLHFSALAWPFSGKETHVSEQKKFQFLPHICLLLNFYRKKFKNRFFAVRWFAIIFFSSIDFGCKNAKALSRYVFRQFSSLITLK